MHSVIATPLTTSAPATAPNVGRLRRALHRWLSDVLVDDPDTVDDLTLAAGEGLENAVDHAFAHSPSAGTMRLRAVDRGDHIRIVVSDDGRWQQPAKDTGHRGRGIDLMSHLADASRIDSTAGGTSITLVHRRRPTVGPATRCA